MEPSDHLFRRESARIITARAAARPMIKQRSGVIIFVTGSPARAHVPGATAIGVAFGAIGNLTQNLAFEISPFGGESSAFERWPIPTAGPFRTRWTFWPTN